MFEYSDHKGFMDCSDGTGLYVYSDYLALQPSATDLFPLKNGYADHYHRPSNDGLFPSNGGSNPVNIVFFPSNDGNFFPPWTTMVMIIVIMIVTTT